MTKSHNDLLKITYLLIFFWLCLPVYVHADEVVLDPGLDDKVNSISFKLMCPVCQGQSVAESNSNLANDMRAIIRTQLKEGKSEQEILTYFTDRYGDSILAAPPTKGVNWLLWVLPGTAIIIAVLGVGIYLSRISSKNRTVSEQGQSGTENDSYLDKIDKELEKRGI